MLEEEKLPEMPKKLIENAFFEIFDQHFVGNLALEGVTIAKGPQGDEESS